MEQGTYQQHAGDGPLTGIRVIDLTTARSGPTCVRQLADMGADVIQIGNPAKGDLSGSDSWNLHRNKRSALVDLRRDDGRSFLMRLVERSDVLVENFRPAVKAQLRIAPDDCFAINPRLVYASISGFGQDGPYAGRPGLDQIAQGLGGLMSVTGPPGTGPWRVGIAISDTASGTFLTQGVLAALFARERTGQGQWVHTSLLESMINFMDFQAVRYLNEGEVPGQAGNDHPTFFPMGTYRTADGYLNIAAMVSFDRFCAAFGASELASDPRFAAPADRARNREQLRDELEARLATATTAHWVEHFAGADLPCGAVYSVDEVFADAQVGHLNLVRTVDHASAGPVHLLRHPVTMSSTPMHMKSGPPLAGADTRAIALELGFTDIEIDELIHAAVLRDESTQRSSWPTG